MATQALRIAALALGLLALSPASAQETTTVTDADDAEAAVETTTADVVEERGGFDWGLLGLLGLLGLAGLGGRRREAHVVHATTTRP